MRVGDARGDRAERPRLLFLTHRVPYPPDRGDRIRSYNMLKALAGRFDVSVACVTEEGVSRDQLEEMKRLSVRFAWANMGKVKKAWRAGMGVVRGKAITPSVFYDVELASVVKSWHAGERFDAVVSFCSGMTGYAEDVLVMSDEREKPIYHLDLVDVDSAKWASYAEDVRGWKRWLYGREAKLLQEVERGVGADYVSVVSDRELEVYSALRRNGDGGGKSMIVGNGVDLDYFMPRLDYGAEVKDIVFVGVLDYKPNVEGVVWFANQVMGQLREIDSEVRFKVVGKDACAEVLGVDGVNGTEVVGAVDDVRPYIWGSAVVVAPLALARGVQNKVLEAMSCGRTVVCSPAAAAGVDAMVGRDLFTAKNAGEYVKLISRLLKYPEAREVVGQAARRRMEERYGWRAAMQPLVELLSRNVGAKGAAQGQLSAPEVQQAMKRAA